MAYEMLYGLNVVDNELYSAYRRGMMPILKSFGGTFRYDFTVDETLKSEAPHAINRVFLISFPDLKAKEGFFTNPDYLKVKKEFFVQAVKDTTMLAEIVT